MNAMKRWFEEWRPSAVTLGAPVYPLLVLFGLNAVDELDRSAFGVLLPDIRDHFHLHNAQALAIVSVTTILVTLIEIPLSVDAVAGGPDESRLIQFLRGGLLYCSKCYPTVPACDDCGWHVPHERVAEHFRSAHAHHAH